MSGLKCGFWLENKKRGCKKSISIPGTRCEIHDKKNIMMIREKIVKELKNNILKVIKSIKLLPLDPSNIIKIKINHSILPGLHMPNAETVEENLEALRLVVVDYTYTGRLFDDLDFDKSVVQIQKLLRHISDFIEKKRATLYK